MRIKHHSTLFLKFIILLIGIVYLLALIWFPQTEGRAANLDLFHIYADPVILYMYVASLPFFTALYQAVKLLGYIEHNKVFSQAAVNTLRTIKFCFVASVGFMLLALPKIMIFGEQDDAPGVVLLGLLIILAASVVATAAGIFQTLLQSAVNLKSENDLTV